MKTKSDPTSPTQPPSAGGAGRPKVAKPSRLDVLIAALDIATHNNPDSSDRVLYLLLKKYRAELPVLDDYFHKCFRQCDVIDDGDGTIDIVIHKLLTVSEVFWDIFAEVHRASSKATLASLAVKQARATLTPARPCAQ